ncbi:MAG: cation diffusion facilitator family transporter [Actinobacteria bacterium]|nr:MAG: cation diffusion facilitator family transporter [Actinomycetota bacterium]
MTKTERAALSSAIICGILAAALIVYGIVVKSMALFAGGMLTLVRSITGLMLLCGLRLSRRHPDDFPLGLYKLENLISVIIGALILLGAYLLAKVAIHQLRTGANLFDMDHLGYALLTLSLSMAIALFNARRKYRVAREENSPGMKADARHSLLDAVGLALIILGVSLEYAGVPRADAAAALVLVLIVIWMGSKVTLDGLKVLLDASVEKEVLDRARIIAGEEPRVSEVLDVQGRNSGSYRFMSLSLELYTCDLREAESIAADVRERLRAGIDNVDRISIDFSLEGGKVVRCAVPLQEDGIAVSPRFEDAPCFGLLEIRTGDASATSREIIDNPLASEEEGKGVRLAVFLALRGVGTLLLHEPLPPYGTSDTLDAYEMTVLVEPRITNVEEAERLIVDRGSELTGCEE